MLIVRGAVFVGAGSVWEISAPATQFFCEPKTALKIVCEKTP